MSATLEDTLEKLSEPILLDLLLIIAANRWNQILSFHAVIYRTCGPECLLPTFHRKYRSIFEMFYKNKVDI